MHILHATLGLATLALIDAAVIARGTHTNPIQMNIGASNGWKFQRQVLLPFGANDVSQATMALDSTHATMLQLTVDWPQTGTNAGYDLLCGNGYTAPSLWPVQCTLTDSTGTTHAAQFGACFDVVNLPVVGQGATGDDGLVYTSIACSLGTGSASR